MREAVALLRVGWLSAASYRLNLMFSLLGLGVSLIPIYFIAQALQPLTAASISGEGGHYFGFLAVGLAVFFLVSSALMSLPNAIGGGIASGTLEALLATPAPLPVILLGLVSFDMMWALVRAGCLLGAAAVLGVRFDLAGLPVALLALLLTVAAYFGLSLGLAGMILLFRTIGPMGSGLLAASGLLGGAYYSTTVIPSWIQQLSVVVPLTYGLRVIRKAVLAGASGGALVPDLTALGLAAAILLLIGGACFGTALRHARGQGSLGQY
jgi:ABC-2 type transport system permease protein